MAYSEKTDKIVLSSRDYTISVNDKEFNRLHLIWGHLSEIVKIDVLDDMEVIVSLDKVCNQP